MENEAIKVIKQEILELTGADFKHSIPDLERIIYRFEADVKGLKRTIIMKQKKVKELREAIKKLEHIN